MIKTIFPQTSEAKYYVQATNIYCGNDIMWFGKTRWGTQPI